MPIPHQSYCVLDRTSGYEFRNVQFSITPRKGEIVLIEQDGRTPKGGAHFVIEDVCHADFDGKEVSVSLCARAVVFSPQEGIRT